MRFTESNTTMIFPRWSENPGPNQNVVLRVRWTIMQADGDVVAVGTDRPADYSVEIGYKVIGF